MAAKLKTLLIPFLLCYFGELYLPIIIPNVRFIPYAPLITIIISRFNRAEAIWLAALVGLMIDLYSKGAMLGVFSLNYCISTIIIYRYRKFFSEEKIHIYALYTTLFSVISTAIHFFLFALVETPLKLTFFTIFTDLILMPIFDGVYALVFILTPVTTIKYLSRPSYTRYYKSIYLKVMKNFRSLLAK